AAAVTQQLAASARVLEPLQDRGFFVFHRAWDHWVEQFGLNQGGAFTLSPEYKPGARTLQSMRAQLQRGEVVCVFSEPEFSPALVDAVVKGLAVKRAELDPLAQHIPLGADGYVRYLADLTGRFATCLKPWYSHPETGRGRQPVCRHYNDPPIFEPAWNPCYDTGRRYPGCGQRLADEVRSSQSAAQTGRQADAGPCTAQRGAAAAGAPACGNWSRRRSG